MMIRTLVAKGPFTLLLSSIFLFVQADSTLPPLPTEEDFLGELPVVLSVTRLAQPLAETPASVTIIDREMIEASGARNIAELFRLVPGMQVGSWNGHAFSVTYHGLSDQFSRRMQVLVDGRSVYSPDIGGVRWSYLPLALDDIARIEVIRGPNAATYGANSFLGVISISTRQTAEVSGSRITLNRGEDDIADVTLRHAGAVGEVDYRFTLGYQQDNGFDNRPDDKHVRMATLHADYSPTLNDSLEFQAGYNGGPREEGFPTDSAYPEGTDQIHSHFEQFKWQHQWSPYSETNLHFYHNYQKTDEYRGGIADLASGVNLAGLQLEYATTNDISEDNFAILPIENSTKAERFDLELSHLVDSHDGNWRLVLGASARRDNVSTPLYLGTNETLENRVYRLFSNLEWRLTPRLITNAGAMLENNDITGTDLSPRLAFNYRLNPSHTLRTSVSKALRTPVQVENRADYKLTFGPKFVSTLAPFLTAFAPDVLADLDAKRGILTGPGDLKPEKIVSREIGYLGTFPDYGLDMDIRLFYDSISNIIQSVDIPTSTGTGRTTSNDYSVKSHGWEAQLNWKPSSTNRLALTYAKLHQHADSSNQVKTSKKTIRTIDNLRHSAPRHTFSLLGIHRFPKQITASAAYYLIGTQSWLGEGNADIPYIRRLDLRLAKEFRIGRSRLDLALVAQNVLDDYTDLLFEPGEPERHNIVNSRVFLTLGMEF